MILKTAFAVLLLSGCGFAQWKSVDTVLPANNQKDIVISQISSDHKATLSAHCGHYPGGKAFELETNAPVTSATAVIREKVPVRVRFDTDVGYSLNASVDGSTLLIFPEHYYVKSLPPNATRDQLFDDEKEFLSHKTVLVEWKAVSGATNTEKYELSGLREAMAAHPECEMKPEEPAAK